MKTSLARLLDVEGRRQQRPCRIATACAMVASGAAVALLSTSGWFLTAAAGAGLAGAAAAHSFNYLLPSAAIRLLAIGRTGARYGERLFGHAFALRTLARARPAIFDAIARNEPSRALSVSNGEAATSLVQDVGTMEGALVRRMSNWGAPSAVFVGSVLTALVGWQPLLSNVVCVGLSLAGTAVVGATLAVSARTVRAATGALKEELALLASVHLELRCLGREAWAEERLARLGDTLAAAKRVHAGRLALLEGWQIGMLGVATAAALWFARDGATLSAALAALAAVMTMEGVAPLSRHLTQRAEVAEAARRLDAHLARVDLAFPTIRPMPGPGCLTWQYPVAASFPPGSRVAIVGASGSGKTRFVETLIGLRPDDDVRFMIDGLDMASMSLASRRARFAWLPQDAILLAGTLRENLSLAGDDIDELSMWRALRDAALDDVVRAMPDGLDTWIGEDGARLSGGERRRLGLARAMLVKAPWLLLDEPTEGLDATLERRVLARLSTRLRSTAQGLIVVTHRPAVMAFCERRIDFGANAAEPADQSAAAALGRPW